MFWGLIMEPRKRYTQIVEKSFHVSMASLDVATAGSYNGAVQVMINYENRNYLLCTLQKEIALQVPLDLNFQEGTKIAFTSNGSGHVHLTGYLVPEEDDIDDLLEEEEEEDAPQLVGKSSKRKSLDISNLSENSAKRSKHEEEEESSDDDEDNSESGEEFKDDNLLEDEEDDDEDDEEIEEEEEEVVVEQPIRKTKQQKQQESKKQNLVNGKDARQEQKQQEKKVKGDQQSQNKQEQKKRVIEGGVQIEDLKVGNGAPAKTGKFISVYYIGRLKNGKKFDSCNQGDGFKFRLGKKEVIQGWDVGIAGMKIGGKRRITIPPALAYGAKGSPPVIPPNSQLVFEVELKNVH